MNHNQAFRRSGIFIILMALAVVSCSGVADIPNLFATETPTPTQTFTPSPTFTPAPTPTETLTPSPTPMPTGVKTEEQPDGSTRFTDYDNQYQLTLPKDWLVIPLSSEDLAGILNKLANENPDFTEIAETFAQLDPDLIRVIAVNRDTKYISNGFSTNLTVTAIEDKLVAAMPLDFVTGAVEESLKQQGATLLSSSHLATSNANGVEIGAFDFQQTAPTSTGATIQARSRVMIFQSGGKVIMIQLATPVQFGDELLPIMDEMRDSIKLMNP